MTHMRMEDAKNDRDRLRVWMSYNLFANRGLLRAGREDELADLIIEMLSSANGRHVWNKAFATEGTELVPDEHSRRVP